MLTKTPTIPVLLALSLACAGSPEPVRHHSVAPPLAGLDDAYAAAGLVQLPQVGPTDYPYMQHVFYLSEDIVSGAEPQGPEAFAKLAEWGVKTILSVDGKVPDHALAAEYGLSYVHVPIQYKGISEDELLKIAKTFRELPAPFFVHCFHGKHRGAAAAAVGRIVLDGASRERAIGEMRQYCSASGKYTGLYDQIAAGSLPTPAETRAYAYDFAPEHSHGSYRDTMIELARTIDNVKLLEARDWIVDPAHPDLEPLQEVTQLHQLLVTSAEHQTTLSYHAEEDFVYWLQESLDASGDLVQSLQDCSQDLAGWPARADDAFTRTVESCLGCHAEYRNR